MQSSACRLFLLRVASRHARGRPPSCKRSGVLRNVLRTRWQGESYGAAPKLPPNCPPNRAPQSCFHTAPQTAFPPTADHHRFARSPNTRSTTERVSARGAHDK